MTAQQLRKSILQMAVQGKLVPQDPSDEPAHVLLERIRAEKERLIKEKKIKKEKNSSVIYRGTDNLHYEKFADGTVKCIKDEIPFEIPQSWAWERIKNIGIIIRGSGIKRSEIVENGFPCVRYGELYTTYDISFTTAVSCITERLHRKSKQISYGDILMTLTGENKPDIAKAVTYLGKQRVAVSGDLAIWAHHGMNPVYLSYLLASPYAIERKTVNATGNIIVHISGEKIGKILIPIAPLSEQKRIVQKVQELEFSLDEYQEKEYILANLQYTFSDALKKSILQYAVQGKLVPQDENDEPASVLLERIQEEKKKLIKDGKLKKDKHESVIFGRDNSYYERLDGVERCIDDEIPFEIPKSWVWVRLGNIGCWRAGATPNRTNPEFYNGNIPWLKTGDLTDTYIISIPESITKLALEKTNIRLNPAGSILIAMYGATIGKLGILTFPATTNQACCACTPLENVDGMYLFYFLMSHRSFFLKSGEGGAQSNISKEKIISTLMPLPPLLEQKRIASTLKQILFLTKAL